MNVADSHQTQQRTRPEGGCRLAFSLVELLVVIAIIGILALLLLPVLTRAKQQAEGIQCLSNLRQFAYAWLTYVEDNSDRVPPNNGSQWWFGQETNTWVRGMLTPAQDNWPDNTNTLFLATSLLASHLASSIGVWHCPGDKSTSRHAGGVYARVRSYSMNGYVGRSEAQSHPLDPFRVARRIADMKAPPPAGTWVLLDEREDSIDDCYFALDMFNGSAHPGALPGSYHNGVGNLAFADGHGERRKWLDPRTKPPLKKGSFVSILWTPGPPNRDVLWLRERTTGPVDANR